VSPAASVDPLWRRGARRVLGSLNAALAPAGVRLSRVLSPHDDLQLYPDVARPLVPRYVNVGAGAFFHPLWHNLDVPNAYYRSAQRDHVHIVFDLTGGERLPLDDRSLSLAYCSHVVEHLPSPAVEHLFRELRRCLAPGGLFRVTCPDMDLEYRAYVRGDAAFWRWKNAYGVFPDTIEQKLLDHFATILTRAHPETAAPKVADAEVARVFRELSKAAAFEHFIKLIPADLARAYPADHVNWFDAERLIEMLRRAGFAHVYESRFGQSRAPQLRNTRLFDTTCPELSVYVEAEA